jgi:hypothetical protein
VCGFTRNDDTRTCKTLVYTGGTVTRLEFVCTCLHPNTEGVDTLRTGCGRMQARELAGSDAAAVGSGSGSCEGAAAAGPTRLEGRRTS